METGFGDPSGNQKFIDGEAARRWPIDTRNGRTMKKLGIGLIGSGFMGKAHALAFRTVGGVFDLPAAVELEILADTDTGRAPLPPAASASTQHRRLAGGVERSRVAIVAITTPNLLHKPMALAAIAAGKAVYCENPRHHRGRCPGMVAAARRPGCGYPGGFQLSVQPHDRAHKEIVDSGELGEITGFRGIHAEGFMADPATPTIGAASLSRPAAPWPTSAATSSPWPATWPDPSTGSAATITVHQRAPAC